MFYDYVDTGSWTEYTHRANEVAFQRLEFRQRVAVGISKRTTATQMIGQAVSMPLAIAPTGLRGMVHLDGDILAAKAAQKAAVPFTLSTRSICSIEAVAPATNDHPFWFQLYVMRDRDFVASLIRRAQYARCSALMVTMDLQGFGQWHKEKKNGLSAPPKRTLHNLLNLATKPHWCSQMLHTKHRQFGNIIGRASGVDSIGSLVAWTKDQNDPCLSWHNVEWIKKLWDGKLFVTGIMDEPDARHAVAAGADALIVSNHGGRQLDGASALLAALPHIVQAIGPQIEVHFDGGIRSGQDGLKACALRANGTYIGRAMLHGLGAAGEQGVGADSEIIRNELDLSMAFCGKTGIAHGDQTILC